MLPILTHSGVVKEYIAGEDIKNNDIYIVDTDTQQIRKPKKPDEWFYCQVVYVYETNPWAIDGITEDCIKARCVSREKIDGGTIKKGERCRCWLGFFRVQGVSLRIK